MYRHTLALQRMVSTSHGQRRILKKSPPVQKYIRQAVESGTYPQDEESQQRNQRKAPYGSNFRDYPIEYEILTLYPPIPPPPRIPKHQRGLRKKDSHVPTDKLIAAYLKRYEQEDKKAHAISEREYYEKLLGIPPPSAQSAMGRKSAVLNKAYAFALRQYQVMRQDDDMTEQESIDYVNKLLEEEKKDERYASRATSAKIEKWRQQGGKSNGGEEQSGKFTGFQDEVEDEEDSSWRTNENDTSNSYPSILHSKPRAIEGMALWSQRLKAVPYREWTIGASTALDHWIARSILEMEEDTWQELLEGNSPHVASQGKDIITVRQSLFPETILDQQKRQEVYGEEDTFEKEDGGLPELDKQDDGDDFLSPQDKSIDELLASLGGFDTDIEDNKESDTKRFFPSSSVVNEDDVDAKVSSLVDELQTWRQRNVESPYEDWPSREKDDFASWLNTYVETLASNREGQVDLVATRKALLESAPIDKDESEKFWQQLRDETEAEILLQSIKNEGLPSPDRAATTGERKAREAFAFFHDLPYEVQLQKLVDLGTLRPIMDEYASESDRVKFLARYGEKLMEGVEMEHLVSDPEGPISGADLGRWGEENEVGNDERFRLEMVAYGSDDFGNEKSHRAREMYSAWNTHKAGRARFEEVMFKKDRLGLRYNLDKKGKVQTTLEKE